MSIQPNHYETLGLPPTATAEQIKRKYRELARRYHPDVNSSPDAAQKILSINQAYQVLGDAARRAAYDAERVVQQTAQRSERPSTSTPRTRQNPASPSNPRSRVYYDGFGRAYTPPKPERQKPPSTENGAAKQKPDSQKESIERALAEAKLAFINRQFQEAMRLCLDVLRISPGEAVAHEILGDIYMRQGDKQRATTAFSYAIQLNPRNQSAQAKLERILRLHSRPAERSPITFTRPEAHETLTAPLPDAVLAVVTVLAVGVLAGTLLATVMMPGGRAAENAPGLFGLTLPMAAALGVSGLAGGVLLAFFARMRSCVEELGFRQKADGSRSPAPQGVLLAVLALVWFYGSFLVYIGICATRNRFSPSVLRAYATTLGLILVFTLTYHLSGSSGAGWRVTLLGGNILFPMVLGGWLLGDAFRLRGRV